MARIKYEIDDSSIQSETDAVRKKIADMLGKDVQNPNSELGVVLSAATTEGKAFKVLVNQEEERLKQIKNTLETELESDKKDLQDFYAAIQAGEEQVRLGVIKAEDYEKAAVDFQLKLDSYIRERFPQIENKINTIDADIANIEGFTNQIDDKLTEEEKRASTLGSQINSYSRGLSQLVSGVTGFASLATAISGRQQDQMISTMLAVASNSLQLFATYGAIGAASGNLALVAAAGSGASGLASIINTINAVGQRQQANQEAESRRLQQLRQ